MCGILGIVGQSDVAPDLYRGMLALQHRGQDSAGMACLDRERINLRKGLGLVSEIFNDQTLPHMKGSVGVGHVRYATAGSSPKLDSQPFMVSVPHVLAFAHNGNAINYKDWEEEFRDRTESCCDSEILLHLFSKHLSKAGPLSAESVFTATREFMREVNGSFSIIALIGKVGLLAFRDPHANRPLVFGKRGKDVAFASESVALDATGFTLVRDLNPGEAILVQPDGTFLERVILPKAPRHCMFEWVYFARPDSIMENKSVYDVRIELGRQLARAMKKEEIDVVVPVPDTSRPAALGLAEELDLNMQEGLIKNRYIGRTFIMPTQESRQAA
ncbi:MAG TPA: amidophosphoribosyltransferase, partial [Candidatus Norongarragalinales archaeon]|nr:amidophosphoribosyltransferase [Candidatus Norongarragalinales archaeon]